MSLFSSFPLFSALFGRSLWSHRNPFFPSQVHLAGEGDYRATTRTG